MYSEAVSFSYIVAGFSYFHGDLLFFLLHNESLRGEERPEGPPPKATTFMSTVVVWPSYLEQTCLRESALLGLSLIKFAHPITDVNLKGEVRVEREWEAEENVRTTPPHTRVYLKLSHLGEPPCPFHTQQHVGLSGFGSTVNSPCWWNIFVLRLTFMAL